MNAKFLRASFLLVTIVLFGNCATLKYWPTKEWRTSAPEEQGMDSRKLEQIDSYIKKHIPFTSSVLVVRNGFIVFERYYDGKEEDFRALSSMTKSIISALVGIAIEEGFIDRVEDRVIDYFPEWDTEDLNSNVREVTIRHLLTMSSGFGHDPLGEVIPDKIRGELESSSITAPGTTFEYNSTNAHLLSMIISKTTGITAEEFARQYLFEPIGIDHWKWETFLGYSAAGAGLRLSTRDLARFGYLYANDGTWGRKQVVPAEWVRESTMTHMHVKPEEQIIGENYGYLWWTLELGDRRAYTASGGSRYVCVVPDLNLVYVITTPGFMWERRVDYSKPLTEFALQSIFE